MWVNNTIKGSPRRTSVSFAVILLVVWLSFAYYYDNVYPHHHYVYPLGHCNDGSTPNRIGLCANGLHPESSRLAFMETILKQNPALVDILDLLPMVLLSVGGLIIVWLFLHNNLSTKATGFNITPEPTAK
jgi:hypothetical protein